MSYLKELRKCKGKRLAFDLDKTLTLDSVKDWDTYGVNELAEKLYKLKPNRPMIDLVNQLSENNTIYIYTARNDYRQELTYKWLKVNGVNFKYLQMNKNHFDFLIDDSAISAIELQKELEEENDIGK